MPRATPDVESSQIPPGGQDAPESAIRAAQLSTVWFDRDLGWLEFNRRVLAEALDERTPLLERVKFLAIFTSNLDEFFMKRMAVLREHRTPARQQLIARDSRAAAADAAPAAECFRDRLVPELARHRIHLRHWDALSDAQRREAARVLRRAGLGRADAARDPPDAAVPVLLQPLALARVRAARRSDGRVRRRAREGAGRAAAVGAARRGRAARPPRVRPAARGDPRERAQAVSRHAADARRRSSG